MRTQIEFVDVLGDSGLPRLGLLYREGFRRHTDTSWRTWFLSLLDQSLGMGHWWFRTFEYRCLNPDGSMYRRQIVRQTLAGYTIAWGHSVEYYDGGLRSSEGLTHAAAFRGKVRFRKHRYWLEDGTSVSQSAWMHHMFGPAVEGCYDPAWES